MYLYFYIILLISRFIYIVTDCGCNLNRNSVCLKEDNFYLYSEKLNKLTDDDNNDEINKYVHKYAFNRNNMVYIDGGLFQMGTNEPVFEADFEGPIRNVTVDPFYLDKFEVSNEDFSTFVEQTGYITEAEKFGDSFIFELLIPEKDRKKYDDFRAVSAPWWIKMKGVNWKHPEGKSSTVKGFVTAYLY